MFKWLTQRSFFANLIAACILFFLLGVLFFASLGLITRHGQTEKVPDVNGQSFSSAKKLLTALNFNVIVQDSAYVDSLPPLSIVRQMPDSGSVVKVDRTIYLTLNKTSPPLTAMPELVNYSFRSAVMTLESQRLQLGDTLYKPDIAKDAVLDQLYQGKSIKAGTMIPEGSKITLVLGDGVGNVPNPVPNLIGITYQQALDLLSGSSLSPGVVLTSGTLTDTMNAFVFKQNPAPVNQGGQPNYIRSGETIDMWISQANPADTLKVDSTK
ncbi:MAG: PASTA domain-containing protein [Chitinophagaceae bacterium]